MRFAFANSPLINTISFMSDYKNRRNYNWDAYLTI